MSSAVVAAWGMSNGDIAVATAQGVAAFATIALAIMSWRQIKLSSKEVAVSRESAAAAVAASREAARARSDDRAPTVIPLLAEPDWPPVVDPTRHAMPNANELRLLDPMSLHSAAEAESGREFVFPQEEHSLLWFTMRGVLVNAGKTPARVRLNGEAEFRAATSPLDAHGPVIALPTQLGTPDRNEFVLNPGQEAVFAWAGGCTLGTWAAGASSPSSARLFFSATVFDYFANGVVDRISIEVSGRPLEAVPGRASHWRVTDRSSMGMTCYPTDRWYRAEGGPMPVPPWG